MKEMKKWLMVAAVIAVCGMMSGCKGKSLSAGDTADVDPVYHTVEDIDQLPKRDRNSHAQDPVQDPALGKIIGRIPAAGRTVGIIHSSYSSLARKI